MVQLTSDCFAFGGRLTRIDEALQSILESLAIKPETEQISLNRALNRFLAEDVIALENVPADNNSAVDGYSIFFDDLNETGSTALPVIGKAAAGRPLNCIQKRGEAVRIFTGAVMPHGANSEDPDTVLMQEDIQLENEKVIIPPGIKRGSNRRLLGEDIVAGTRVLEAGMRLRPQDIGLAAATGKALLSVRKPLRVAVFSTGDEVTDPGEELARGKIYDSNRFTLMNLLTTLGCEVEDIGIIPDKPALIEKAVASSFQQRDLIITSGGVSTGEEDHIKNFIEKTGQLLFWRLAIKPGRPVALGRLKGTFFIGLPGNPVAAMVTFLKIARPIILHLSGAKDIYPRPLIGRADFDYTKKPERKEFVRVKVDENEKEGLVFRKYKKEGAGILSSLVFADGLVELSEEATRIRKGDTVKYFPFSEFGI
ncbi:MAG: molybdopterin molybdenumtransferase MoeA [Rhodospirillaceae bacterium]|nr:molybdopterin molybdenumtransferase MoeA [Rhodospirillaceae bacterium]OUU16340.1 MAG: molybdopterin molybdenumtransferase MoeA [Candidatus Endolissoclinum sp. TMED37]